jgi:hypothetical protein
MDAITLTAITFTCTFIAYYAGRYFGGTKGQAVGMAIVMCWLKQRPESWSDCEKDFYKDMKNL